MTTEPRVLDLLVSWQERRDRGEEATPEAVCAGCPELTEAVRDGIARLRRFDRAADAAPPAAPPNIPGYERLEEVGRGGMAVVYRAWHGKLSRQVALKVIRLGPHATARQRHRFREEAHCIARLRHPGIVQIHDVGTEPGALYLALEYLAGGSLKDRLAKGPLAPREAAELVGQVARAVAAAHAAGVIHRDLKPSNVLLGGDGAPRLTDFGIARRVDLAEGLTGSGETLGTPSYMAPEQAAGDPGALGPAVDVYGLGAILYEVLTGRPPFQAATPLETLAQVRGREPVPPRRLNPAVPRDLETVCLKCLQKEPARRYTTADALADDLLRFLSGESIEARPVGPAESAWRWCRRNPGVAGLAAALAVAVLGGLGGMYHLWQQEKARTLEAQAHERWALDSLRETQAAQQRSEKTAAVALEALTSLGVLMGSPFPRTAEEEQRVRLESITQFKGACQRLLALDEGNTAVQSLAVGYCSLLGAAYQGCGRMADARVAFEEAVQLYQAQVRGNALTPEFHGSLAHLLGQLSSAHTHLGEREAGKRRLAEALHHWEQSYHLSKQGLTQRADDFGCVWRSGETGRRIVLVRRALGLPLKEYYEEAVDLLGQARNYWAMKVAEDPDHLELRRQLDGIQAGLVECHVAAGRWDRAFAARAAHMLWLQDREEWQAEFRDLAAWLGDLEKLWDTPAWAEAIQAALPTFRRRAHDLEQRAESLPARDDESKGLLRRLYRVGLEQDQAGQTQEALENLRRARSVLERAFSEATTPANRLAWADRARGAGMDLRVQGVPRDALCWLEGARRTYQELAALAPTDPVYRIRHASSWYEIGKTRENLGETDGAFDAFRAALASYRQAFGLAPEQAEPRRLFSLRLGKVAFWFQKYRRTAEAAACYMEQEQLWPDHPAELLEIARDWRTLAGAVGNPGQELTPDQRAECYRYVEQCLRVELKASNVPRP